METPIESDAEIVAGVLSGSDAHATRLAEKYRPLVSGIAHRFAWLDDPLDLAQIIWRRAFASLPKFCGDGHPHCLAPWLRTVATRACQSYAKRFSKGRGSGQRPYLFSDLEQRRQPDESEPTDFLDGYRPPEQPDTSALREAFGYILPMLSPRSRRVIELKLEGLSLSEIAEATRWTANHTRFRAWTALAEIRKLIRKRNFPAELRATLTYGKL